MRHPSALLPPAPPGFLALETDNAGTVMLRMALDNRAEKVRDKGGVAANPIFTGSGVPEWHARFLGTAGLAARAVLSWEGVIGE